MATETIKVTIEDIREAHLRQGADDYREECECPIAQAVRRIHPDAVVSDTFISLNHGPILLPHAARVFIRRFDHEQPVEPFEFTIEV